jgi:mRNA-decapping enzyme subunit 2
MKVEEEIGFDISPFIKEDLFVEMKMKDKRVRLYIITNIPEETEFVTRTRKEIGVINYRHGYLRLLNGIV